MEVIGAEKNPTDNGALVRIETVEDFDINRLRVKDSSSYGIYVTGYGIGPYQDDPTSDYWNSTKRGNIRNCVGYRGQISFGLEGGAQDVNIVNNVSIDSRHVGFRIAASKNLNISGNRDYDSVHYSYWFDRCEDLIMQGNWSFNTVGGGIAIAGAELGSDGGPSKNMKILNNTIITKGTGISDSYQGNSTKYVDGVDIIGNTLDSDNGKGIYFLYSKNINVQMNRSSNQSIIKMHNDTTTGIIANNQMGTANNSANVVERFNL